MITKDLVAASSKPLVLSILSHGESYGYAIIQQVRALSNGELEWTDGMLYPVLHRLERKGLIRSRWEVSDAGRKRKYYSLSPKGAKQLKVEQKQWLAVHTALAQLWEARTCLT